MEFVSKGVFNIYVKFVKKKSKINKIMQYLSKTTTRSSAFFSEAEEKRT
jgi:hypothetical protein